jgi:hypothetical protein
LFFINLVSVTTRYKKQKTTRSSSNLVSVTTRYKKQQGRHPILFQSLLDIKKQQGRHPILFQSLLDIKNVVTETRLDDDLVVFCFLYLVVTETRLDDDLVVFCFFISSSD